MDEIPYIDVHTHLFHAEKETVTVQNIFPGESFAVFSGRNFYSVGLHPWHIKTPKENSGLLDQVAEALEFDHVIFVGESGLDKRVDIDFEEQKRIFHAHIIMAEALKKPLIIHCVRAYNEVLEMHKKLKPRMAWIFHGYNGSPEMTRQIATENFMFSFGQALFMTESKAAESFKILQPEKIFLETDEFKGEVEQIYRQAATLKNMDEAELKKTVLKNFTRVRKTS